MAAAPAGASHSLDLALTPTLGQISVIREFVESYYQAVLRDRDLICRVGMAAHELLENATKYAKRGGARLRIQVRDDAGPGLGLVSIRVSNAADPARLPDLELIVGELAETRDVSVTYRKYLLRAAGRAEGSGLGLARIRAEAEMTLSIERDGDEVCVHALASLSPEHQP
jgi:two-component sensor histidine kinase